MTTTASDIQAKGAAAREASRALARLSVDVRNRALEAIADALTARESDILAANAKDIEAGRQAGLTEAVLDRLLLTRERLEG
ncbi:MAG: gamma-glutamyl-phosphate reductase, partial [Dehalococcoidia bacterium]